MYITHLLEKNRLDTVIKYVHYTPSGKFGLDTVIKYVHYTPSGKKLIGYHHIYTCNT